MELKKIYPMQVLSFETQTTLNELPEYVRVVAHKMYRVAVEQELEITGPVYWIYKGMDGNPETRFLLTIALPVSFKQGDLNGPEFNLKRLEGFNCASVDHLGPWDKLGETYGAIIPEVLSRGLTLSGQNREIYLNIDFDNPEANITEVQIGITEV
jgi:effector-binding domain-containing protein